MGRARVARLALITANVGVVVFACIPLYRIDLNVYRLGSQVWLHGGSLYGQLPLTEQGTRLPFTYPPFAAIVLSPLSMIPMPAATLVLSLGTLVALAFSLRPLLRPLGWKLGWVMPAAVLLEPVRSTLGYGQVNVLLMALVIADCLIDSPRWPPGLLTGLAAAVKLTPALFVLFFILRRDYRAAATTMLSFAAATGLGFLLAPADSARYWTHSVFNVDRIGGMDYASNQSIIGVLTRAGLRPQSRPETLIWLMLSALVLILAIYGMRKALAAGEVLLALALNGFAELLVSPVSWSHHWVWAEPALLAIMISMRVGWRSVVAWGFVVFAAAPHWLLPHGNNKELHWAIWENVLGDSYAIFAIGFLIWAAWSAARVAPDEEPPAPVSNQVLTVSP
jgi:alpha-1,2-mannosyltransferase